MPVRTGVSPPAASGGWEAREGGGRGGGNGRWGQGGAPLSGTLFWRSRWRRQAKSTRSISWSWLKQEKTTDSLPVTGSLWSCRHWAQISFIMHCMGELIDARDRKSTRLNSSHQIISYAVFCLKK